MTVFDNELTVSNYCLLTLNMVEVYCCTLGMIYVGLT